MKPREAFDHFMQWHFEWAGEPFDAKEADLQWKYTRIIVDSKDDLFIALDVALGALDHGAGNAIVMASSDNYLMVLYEAEVQMFWVDGKLVNTPDNPYKPYA
jgi:hypothetical protein